MPSPNVKAKLITEAKIAGRKVIDQMAPPIGDSEKNLYCAKCGTMLIKGYSPAKFPNIVIRCVNCRSLNEP
jgi:hypothetical protein